MIVGSLIAAGLVLAIVAVSVAILFLRSLFMPHLSAPCNGLGHPAINPTTITWEMRSSHRISPVIEVPNQSRGLRVDAEVFGSDNAPIFPDGASISVVDDADLDEALRRDEAAYTTPVNASSVPLPLLLKPVGSGTHAINENVALPPGAYRLVTRSSDAKFGTVTVRTCG